MLVMQAALYGTFTAQNFILWFLFYEMSLIPGFLLIKVWGGVNRDRAATNFSLHFSREHRDVALVSRHLSG
jgi:NADH:ubiquinone oxidoreductase subunit 4 (subunit M)